MELCAPLDENGILNAEHTQWPLFSAVIYGDKTLCTKLSKRLVCSIKHLPLRLSLKIVTSTQAAIEAGVRFDPTLFINGKPFIEGLVAAEEITIVFEKLLQKDAL
jgi:hypothetical protein